MGKIFKSVIRILSFPRKELTEIFRQPLLVLTLVLGPFLIIILFGLGYPNNGRSLRGIFVMGDQNPFAGEMESFVKHVPAIINQGVENDKSAAMAKLRSGQTDMVIVVPDHPLETIQDNEQAKFIIYHNEIDPFQVTLVHSIGRIFTDEVNHQILMDATTQGQAGVHNELSSLSKNLVGMRSVNPNVLISPFTTEFSDITKVQFTPVGFLTPAVIVLLLQHLAITFAALSIVRERRSGIMELFNVSPLNSLETLLGKFLSYMLFGAFIAALLTLLVVWWLGVPMLGTWKDYALALTVLLFTSLGMGFMISLISQTEIQAVQFSMLFLLMSIFFSGFFLDLRFMWDPMRILAWSLPATYGIKMMHDVMLHGYTLSMPVFWGIGTIGIFFFIVDLLLLRRKMEN